MAEDYTRQLSSLKRRVVDGMESDGAYLYTDQTYSEAEEDRLKQSRGKISYKKTTRFRGQANILADAVRKVMAKEYVFYRVVILPYFQFPVITMPPSVRLKSFNWYNIPNDTKRFWAKAKKELIEQIMQYENDNPRIVL